MPTLPPFVVRRLHDRKERALKKRKEAEEELAQIASEVLTHASDFYRSLPTPWKEILTMEWAFLGMVNAALSAPFSVIVKFGPDQYFKTFKALCDSLVDLQQAIEYQAKVEKEQNSVETARVFFISRSVPGDTKKKKVR